MRWHKPHVAIGDMDEGRYVSMASDGDKDPWGFIPDREDLDDQKWDIVTFT